MINISSTSTEGVRPGAALRILLVEDSELLAERLRELLGQIAGVEVVGTVRDERADDFRQAFEIQ